MGKLEKVTVGSDSEMAQAVFSLDIETFRVLCLMLVDKIAEVDGVDREELLHAYTEKNHELCAGFISNINDECETIVDQLVHFSMAVVTMALNFHGCKEFYKGSMEIMELIGEGAEDVQEDQG